jgi:thioesterase domain-containing protein
MSESNDLSVLLRRTLGNYNLPCASLISGTIWFGSEISRQIGHNVASKVAIYHGVGATLRSEIDVSTFRAFANGLTNSMTGTSNTFTDEAHAALWRKMLAVAKHLRDQQPLPVSKRSPVVTIRQGSGGVPVYWIEPDLDEFKLGQLITSNNPIYAVEVRLPSAWYDMAARKETEGMPTLEEIVAQYVAAIKAHTPSSRCVLGGHSFGGVVAFEAARQLALLNVRVEAILLFDAAAIYPSSRESAWQKLKEIWSPAVDTRTTRPAAGRVISSLWIVRWLLGLKWRSLGLKISALTRHPEKLVVRLDDMGKPVTWPPIQYLYDTAMNAHHLSPLDCGGVLFRAESRHANTGTRSLQTHLGWNGLFQRGLEIVSVPGDHMSMLRRPHANVLAREMSLILGRISAAQDECEAASGRLEELSEPRIA